MSFSLTRLLREMRERGLENTFQRYYSNYQAKVVDDADIKAMGRVRVKMESLGYPDDHPDFAEVFSPYAGEDFGFFFPPYKDDEVYVSFDHGDISSPMVMGGYWATSGNKTPSDTEVPTEFVNTKMGDNGEELGDVPTVRGIKVRVGSALAFDETEGNVSVELWTGVSQGKGKRATKLHRLRLDSTKDKGQVVLATYGDENSNAEQPSDMDDIATREKKELEGRLRHQVLMRDTSDDRFIQVKTIGEDDEKKFLQFLMSDTEKKILVQSAEEHYFLIDDENKKSEWKLKDGFRWLIDQGNEKILGETKAGRRMTMDDKNKKLTIETPDNQTFEFSSSETKLEDTGHDINVTGGKNINVESTVDMNLTAMGAMTIDVTNDWMAMLKAMASMIVTGTLTVQASSVVIQSADVQVGTGNLQTLMNKIAMDAVNAHTHNYLLPLHPIASIPTSPPLVPLIDGVHTTVATKGA